MAPKRPIIGERYRNLHVMAWRADWIVDAIFRGKDELEYAYLRSASDRTEYKTLSLSVVSDPSRFALVSAPAAVPPLIAPA
jgi:hypothetical protein